MLATTGAAATTTATVIAVTATMAAALKICPIVGKHPLGSSKFTGRVD